MSKSTSGAFRRVDVDKLTEERVLDDDTATTNGVYVNEDGGPNETYIMDLLSKGENMEALHYVLSVPQVRTKDQSLKNRVVELVMRVLLAFRSQQDIEAAVQAVDPSRLDLLMKYVYRGFEFPTPDGSSALLLVWHEKIFETSGIGTIVRVLTDQKRV